MKDAHEKILYILPRPLHTDCVYANCPGAVVTFMSRQKEHEQFQLHSFVLRVYFD